jgi:hypothetical protein
MINSTCFCFDQDGKAVRIPWVNLGLLLPLTEKKISQFADLANDKEDASPLESLGRMHDDFVSDCPNQIRGASVFVHHHLRELKTTPRNLYGPVNLGGLGASPVPSSKADSLDGYNFRQLTIASAMRDGFVSCPSYASQSASSGLVARYVRERFGEVVDLWDTVEVPAEGEDVTDAIVSLTGRLRTMLSWLCPLGLQGSEGHDHRWAKEVMRKYQFHEPMGYRDYIDAPRGLRKIAISKRMSLVFPEEGVALHDYLLD